MGNVVNKVVEVGSLGLVQDVTGTEAAADAATKAGEVQAAAASQGVVESGRQFDITEQRLQEAEQFSREQLQPFQEAGVGALGAQQNLIGLGGQEAQQAAFDNLAQSPGQKFLQDRAQKNLLRSSAAIGGLGGGNVRSELVQQGVGFAQQDIQNQFGRLGQIAGQGQSAATNVSQNALGTAGQIGQFGAQSTAQQNSARQSAAEARASGILGAGQTQAQFTGQLIGAGAQAAGAYAASDKRLKSDVTRVGEANGHNWYTWTWNYLANKLGLFGESNGVIADEVQKVKPHLVIEQDGYLAVNYAGLGV